MKRLSRSTKREKAQPADHPRIAYILHNLAGLYQAQDRLAEAEPHQKRSLETLEKTMPAGHQAVAIVPELDLVVMNAGVYKSPTQALVPIKAFNQYVLKAASRQSR